AATRERTLASSRIIVLSQIFQNCAERPSQNYEPKKDPGEMMPLGDAVVRARTPLSSVFSRAELVSGQNNTGQREEGPQGRRGNGNRQPCMTPSIKPHEIKPVRHCAKPRSQASTGCNDAEGFPSAHAYVHRSSIRICELHSISGKPGRIVVVHHVVVADNEPVDRRDGRRRAHNPACDDGSHVGLCWRKHGPVPRVDEYSRDVTPALVARELVDESVPPPHQPAKNRRTLLVERAGV